MKLFVDSSGWIGLFSAQDKYHETAVQAFQSISNQPAHFFTSDYIIDETLTHLLSTYGHSIAVQFGRWVLASPLVDILHVDEQIWEEAWRMFQQYNDKAWAFTDCTSFVLMQQHSLYHTFAFNHHFTQAGFILWPKKETGD